MSQSIESLIRVANDNLKSESEYIQKEIEKIYQSKNITEIDNLINSNDDLNYTLKNIKRLKLLIKKLKRIKEMKNELMYAYKPERITSDDEEEWMEEEKEYYIKWIQN